MSQPIIFNEGQNQAYSKVLRFLFSPDLELSISGPAGTGKTALMLKIINELLAEYKMLCELDGTTPIRWEPLLTATTHKAAGALSRATNYHVTTLHSLLGMRIINNFDTGKKELIGPAPSVPLRHALIFVDEASMLAGAMREILVKLAHESQAKVIYIGDGAQLNPINEAMSPVYSRTNTYDHELTQPMRNKTSPGLMALCSQLRATVKGGPFLPMQLVPGEVDYLPSEHAMDWLTQSYATQIPDFRILTYTNERAIQYNSLIRQIRGFPDDFFPGENVVCNNRVVLAKKNYIFPDEEMVIVSIDPTHRQHDFLEHTIIYRTLELRRQGGQLVKLSVPTDMNQIVRLAKHLKRKKAFSDMFALEEHFADLRPGSACTTHKSQGSTYDAVLVDLSDFHMARDRETMARLLYVGVSRARHRVLFTGRLPSHLFPSTGYQFLLPHIMEPQHAPA